MQAHSVPAISTDNMVAAERLGVSNNLVHLYLDGAENDLALVYFVINRRKRKQRKMRYWRFICLFQFKTRLEPSFTMLTAKYEVKQALCVSYL